MIYLLPVGFLWHGMFCLLWFTCWMLLDPNLLIRSDIVIFFSRYPIHRIPTGPTLQSLDACFLTFHSLSTAFQGISFLLIFFYAYTCYQSIPRPMLVLMPFVLFKVKVDYFFVKIDLNGYSLQSSVVQYYCSFNFRSSLVAAL